MTESTKDCPRERVTRDRKVGIINLGCVRNLVDSQTILGNLKRQGHRITTDVAGADMVVVNTCAFIEEAKKESIDTILDLVELKKQGKLKRIVVAGCLAQRYSKELAEEFKEVDAILGVQKLDRENIPAQVSLTPRHFAYVKICESCYNRCSFCVIPSIKGKFVSRTIESVVREVRELDAQGVKEINVIGQDITAYGMDIYREKALARLQDFPESGRTLPEFPDIHYREVIVPTYRFFYRIKEDVIWIVALWHGAQLPGSPETEGQ